MATIVHATAMAEVRPGRHRAAQHTPHEPDAPAHAGSGQPPTDEHPEADHRLVWLPLLLALGVLTLIALIAGTVTVVSWLSSRA
jgi:hypothetical protein